MLLRLIIVCLCTVLRYYAASAVPIWAMYSMMVLSLPGCAIVLTQQRWRWKERINYPYFSTFYIKKWGDLPLLYPDDSGSITQSAMLDWDEFAKALDIAQLVPERYAAYRPLVTDGLFFFLSHLAPPRIAAIVEEQLALPEDASVAERVVALLHHCPTLHKLGQVVARDQRLAPELRQRLQGLESLPPTTPLPEVLAIIQAELGENAYVDVASEALAEASVAVIVPFEWHDQDSATPQEGVFKVLKPGIEARLQEELEIWSGLGVFLEERCAYHGLPVLDYRETLDSVRKLLLQEIRLDREQAHLIEAARFYADSPRVLIPRLLPFSTARMTAMERVYGGKVTDAIDLPPGERDRLATILIEALLAKPFWNAAPIAVFHADPHAGNLFVTDDGRLAILDWSLTARLSKGQREAVVQIILGAMTLDQEWICQGVAVLGRIPPAAPVLRTAVTDALAQVRRGAFPGFDWLLGLLDRLATTASMGFSEDLVLFRKALLTLSGVVTDVSRRSATDRTLMTTAITQFWYEFPGRALAPFDSRAFATHVANADLVGLWASLYLTAARFWIGTWQDIFSEAGYARL